MIVVQPVVVDSGNDLDGMEIYFADEWTNGGGEGEGLESGQSKGLYNSFSNDLTLGRFDA